MADFHETRMGQEFFLKNFPKLIKEVGRIADSLEGKNHMSSMSNDTILCQKIDEKVFADILADVTKGDVTVGYFHKCIPEFRSKKLDRAYTKKEELPLMKDVLKHQLGKDVKEVFDVHGREGFVYIAFVAENN